MFLKIFFILIQGVFNTQASESYCVSDKSTTWKNAEKMHTLVTPDIHYNKQNLSIKFDIELHNKTVWIGYFKALTAFEYFGCVGEEAVNGSKTFTFKSNGPGLCFSACGRHMLVGLRSEMCYCIENKSLANHHLANCDKACEATDDAFLCGGYKLISLYKHSLEATTLRNIISRDEIDNKCLQISITQQSKARYWNRCKDYYQTMCTFENGAILAYDSEFVPWENATQKCFKRGGYATQYIKNLQKLPTGESWTGVIRSNVIYKYNEAVSWSFGKIECGYTNYTEGVMFTDECESMLKLVLCHNEITSPMTTPATFTTSSKLTSSFDGTDTEIVSPMTTPTTFTSSSKLTSRIDSTDTEVTPSSGTHSTLLTDISAGTEAAVSGEQAIKSGVGAVIGASIVSVLVVIAVVVVIVILKRRKKLPSLCKEAVPAKEFGYQQPKRKIDEISRENHDYDHANVDSTNTVNISSDSNYAHTYFVLEPHVNESYTDNTTYDASGNANKTITEPDNVYNRLKTDNNQTYDHAHTKIRNGVLKFDDTYDTTDKAAMKLKASPGKDSDAFGETDEDAYNHITSKPVTNTKTENEYGVPNTLENAYGDVGANNKNNTHDEGDTYSHINNKPQNKGKQGNPFSESKQMRISKLSEGNQDEDYDVTDGDDKLLTTDNDYSTIGTVH